MIKEKVIRYFKGRKPWSLATDIISVVLILMLVIPSTRSILLSQVAKVRTLFTNPEVPAASQAPVAQEGWNWNLTDMEGRTSTFESLRGQVIFLNQWATWCPPCRAEMPAIEKLWRAYGNQVKFVILTSEEPVVVMEFIKQQGYTFPVYFGRVSGTQLASRSIPATTIIGRQGQIAAGKAGAFDWNSKKIRKLINKLLVE